MKYTYFFLLLLTVIVGGVLYGVFQVNGFPASQQAVALDRARLNDFSAISYRIQDYYSSNKVLPKSIDKVSESVRFSSTPLRLTDPQTKKSYGYHVKGAHEYELCTTFSADYKDQQRSSNGPYTYYVDGSDSIVKINYKKGPACILYTLPKYVYEVTPTIQPYVYDYTPPVATPTPVNKVRSPVSGTIVCSESNFNINWFSKGKGSHTVAIGLVSPENIARIIGTVNIPHENDSEMLDVYTWKVPESVSQLKLPKEYGYYITIADTLNGKTTTTTGEKFEIRNCEG